MALTATIFKANLQISDLDRSYYGDHQLTLARHPSETDERMMGRLLAFALYADENLSFTKGLCAADEPDLWQKGCPARSSCGSMWARRMSAGCARPAIAPAGSVSASTAVVPLDCGGSATPTSCNALPISG